MRSGRCYHPVEDLSQPLRPRRAGVGVKGLLGDHQGEEFALRDSHAGHDPIGLCVNVTVLCRIVFDRVPRSYRRKSTSLRTVRWLTSNSPASCRQLGAGPERIRWSIKRTCRQRTRNLRYVASRAAPFAFLALRFSTAFSFRHPSRPAPTSIAGGYDRWCHTKRKH